MRFFGFAYGLLLHNLWRIVDHSLKGLVSKEYDEYGREPFDERLGTLLPLADFLASSVIITILRLIDSNEFDPADWY